MSKNFNAFIVHGFKSHAFFMKSTDQAWREDKIHHDYRNIALSWDAGRKDESIIGSGLRLVFNRESFLSELEDEWNASIARLDETSKQLADLVCETVSESENKDIVLVGHSLGTEVIRRSIPLINNRINCSMYLFLMAGVANDTDFSDVTKLDCVKYGYNIYSRKDRVLTDILMNTYWDGDFFSSIGRMPMYDSKITDIETTLGHDEYNKSKLITKYYTELMKKLINKGDNEYLYKVN